MYSMRGHEGIQMLLTAEQEAQQIVTAARNLKTTRLRQAEEEAEKEAGLYRSNLESEYQKRVGEVWLDISSATSISKETEAKIRNMKKSTSKFQSDVVVMLIKDVTAVNYLFLYFKNIFE
uniref:V-type proton ATPase subunit G n=1 Tax=Populus trichocarpa TaxID=3694 RepID=B9IQX3_POPTR